MPIINHGMRLRDDYLQLQHNPSQYIRAHPLENNIYEWHYVFIRPHNAENNAYSGGIYHGRMVFPLEFPERAPEIIMLTPNGKFYRGLPICVAIQWSPVWTVGGLLEALFSLMLSETYTFGVIPSHISSKLNRIKLAKESWEFNLTDSYFREVFPDLAEEARVKVFGIPREFVIKRLAKQTYQKAVNFCRVPFNARKLSRMM